MMSSGIRLTPPRRVLAESIILVLVSLIFGSWALAITLSRNYEDGNVIASSIDDGLVCFPLTLCTGIYGIALAQKYVHTPSLWFQRCIIVVFSVTVTIYIWAACTTTDSSVSHVSYLVISAILWVIYGVLYYRDVEVLCGDASYELYAHIERSSSMPGSLSLKHPLIST